ncbi:MAG: hypothetical protein ACKOCW_10970 [Planctomycetaceae bacterium]
MNDDASRSGSRLRFIAIAVAVLVLTGCRAVGPRATPIGAHRGPADPAVAPVPAEDHGLTGTVVTVTHDEPLVDLPAASGVARSPALPAPSGGGDRTCERCSTAACQEPVCLPPLPPPVIIAPPVCDGGDHGRPAVPVGRDGIAHVSAGDTVARYRAADGIDTDEACLATTNCACVFAPRFASVREVIRPFEDTAPTGPQGLALDTAPEADVRGQRVCRATQPIGPEAARRAQPTVAAEEHLPALGIDTARIPSQAEGLEGPAGRFAIDGPRRHEQVDDPRTVTGFDVPYAWTCLSAAQVTVGGESTDVIAVDRGTATLRLEHPGRCELTLCKRAGSDAVRPGEELDFTIFLLNSGDRALADVVLVDAVPPRLEVIPGSAVSNLPADVSTGTAEDGGTLLSWKLRDPLPAGAGGFVRFRTIVR